MKGVFLLVATFAVLDLNGDGRLMWHEAGGQVCVEHYFRAADRDHSGHVDAEEFRFIAARCSQRGYHQSLATAANAV